jgi:hypothetical protein
VSLVRDPQQTTLAGLHARGMELVQRYRDALGSSGVAGPCRAAIAQVLTERMALVEALAAAERACDDLPHEGNAERAAVQSIGDRLSQTLGGMPSLAQRLREGDEIWLDELEAAKQLDWDLDQARLLARLGAHIRSAQAALERACT